MRYGNRTGIVVGGQETGRVMVKDSKSGNVGSYKRESLTRIDSSPPSSAPTLRPEPADSPVWQKPNTDLSDQDKQDMYNYAWDYQSYHALNEPLRDGSLPSDPEDRALLDRLTSLIDRSSLPADATLYRAAFSAEDLIQQIQQAHSSGSTWTEPGFMSTSLDPAKAAEMDNGDSADAAIYFDIGIDAPKGTKALVFDGALADRPDAYDQQEVLLQRGSQFRVDSLTKGADGWHAKMTLVNQPTPKASEGPSEPRGATGTPSGDAGTREAPRSAPEPKETLRSSQRLQTAADDVREMYVGTPEGDLIRRYGSMNEDWNQAARSGDTPPELVRVQQLARDTELPGPVITYRGVSPQTAQALASAKPGDTVPVGGQAIYTTTDKAYAVGYGKDQNTGQSHVIEITTDHGLAIPPDWSPTGMQEQALVVDGSQQFRLVGTRQEQVQRPFQSKPDSVTVYTLEPIGAPEPTGAPEAARPTETPRLTPAGRRMLAGTGWDRPGAHGNPVTEEAARKALAGEPLHADHAQALGTSLEKRAGAMREAAGDSMRERDMRSANASRAEATAASNMSNHLFDIRDRLDDQEQRGGPDATRPEEGVPGNGGPHNGIYTSTDPATPYTVITQHGANGEVRTRHFPTHEAAQAYAEAHNPDTDGSMVPNIDSGIGSHPNYSRGFFHAKVNRYAAIHKHGNNQEGGEPYYGGPRVPHRSFDGTPPKPRSTNMDKLWESGAPIRYRHKTIPPDSPYHLFHVSTGRYDDGKRRAETATKGPVAISKDEVVPVTVSPDELNEMPPYTDLIDRATAKGWAFYGWDPSTDMVLVQDPADGYEKWIPRKQLVARFLPGKWY